VLGNTAVPLVTVIALSYANLLGGSVLTETRVRLAGRRRRFLGRSKRPG
jgi:ABC-type dipeptide/oligopeptide/nickel transport system permease component